MVHWRNNCHRELRLDLNWNRIPTQRNILRRMVMTHTRKKQIRVEWLSKLLLSSEIDAEIPLSLGVNLFKNPGDAGIHLHRQADGIFSCPTSQQNESNNPAKLSILKENFIYNIF